MEELVCLEPPPVALAPPRRLFLVGVESAAGHGAAAGVVRLYYPPPTFDPASDIPSLSGKYALVTGTSSGIGLHTAAQLLQKGAHVYIGGRTAEAAAVNAAEIQRLAQDGLPGGGGGEVEVVGTLDLASLKSTKAFAQGESPPASQTRTAHAPRPLLRVDVHSSRWARSPPPRAIALCRPIAPLCAAQRCLRRRRHCRCWC
eukprot:SAG11_NODE_964_length_6369_cov_7.399362_3_plen_201_part_00